MTAIRKFLFDHSFDTKMPKAVEEADEENEKPEETEPEEVVPTFSEEEMEAARDEAFAKGKEEGINEAAAATERDILASLQKLNEQFTGLYEAREVAETSILDSAVSVAAGITAKVFPALNEQGALGEIERMVVLAMGKIIEEPSVTISIHPDLEAQLNERIASLSNRAGFKGEIRILAVEDIPVGDCHIEWNGGGARRDTAGLRQEIDEIIERNLPGITGSSDEPNTDTPAVPDPEGAEPQSGENPPEAATATEPAGSPPGNSVKAPSETPNETPSEDDTAPDQQGT
jgi:flagellar assembly protein FliH